VNDKHCKYAVILPLSIFATGVLITLATNLDLNVEAWFFDETSRSWPVGKIAPFELAYHFGELAGIIPGVIALTVLIGSIWAKRYVRWRRACWFVLALLVVAPLIIVNGVLKNNWGRPRPRNVHEFGGSYQYQPTLVIGQECGGRKSFPCGHAAMGFSCMAPYFIFKARKHKGAIYWFWGGVAAGLFIGLARMAQGAHWPSDVVWSFGIVYFSGYVLARILHLDRIEGDERQV
jgi:lipid A 4'-phosphatase